METKWRQRKAVSVRFEKIGLGDAFESPIFSGTIMMRIPEVMHKDYLKNVTTINGECCGFLNFINSKTEVRPVEISAEVQERAAC